MINTSTEFKQYLNNDQRGYLYYADLTLADGTVLNLTSENIWTGTFKIEDSVSQDNNFDIGDAIINKASFSINNMYDAYSEYNFEKATVAMYVGLQLSDSLEKLRKYTGIVDEVKYNGVLISLTFLDNMSKFDETFDTSGIEFPATIDQIVRYSCTKCGVKLNTTEFDHQDFIIDSLPEDGADTLTYRQLISYCAQICGYFARCNTYGELELGWYDQKALIISDADGGTFDTTTTPYSDGDKVDGGTFDTTTTPYSDGDDIDAGIFGETINVHRFNSSFSHSVSTDDVVITDVRVMAKDDGTQNTSEWKDGYIIAIKDNPLITSDNVDEIAKWLKNKLIDLKFRQGQLSIPSDPSVEAGDVAVFTDRKGNRYPIIVSSVTFTAGSAQEIRSSAQTPARNSAKTFSQQTKNYVELRKRIREEANARKIETDSLDARINSAAGLYTTIENGDSGRIFYLHNKKDMSDSDIVWKMTSEAWAVSTDGGETWNAGVTVDGDTIARILTATGVNANWINTGELVVRDSDGNVTFFADTATGEVYVKAQKVETKVGESYVTLEDVANELEGSIQTNRSEIETNYQTLIEQTQNSLTLSIQENTQSIQDNADDLQAYKSEQETYFHFTSEGLEIGKTTDGNTPFSTLLSDQKLAFRQNGQDVAYIQYNKMHINSIEAVERWSVGAAENGGFFDFISTKYGMGVKWRAVETEETSTTSGAKVFRRTTAYNAVTDESGVFNFS